MKTSFHAGAGPLQLRNSMQSPSQARLRTNLLRSGIARVPIAARAVVFRVAVFCAMSFGGSPWVESIGMGQDRPLQRWLPTPNAQRATIDPQKQMELMQMLRQMVSDQPREPMPGLSKEQLQQIEKSFEQFRDQSGFEGLPSFEEIPPEWIDQAVKNPQVRQQARRLIEEYSRSRQLPKPNERTDPSSQPPGSAFPFPPSPPAQSPQAQLPQAQLPQAQSRDGQTLDGRTQRERVPGRQSPGLQNPNAQSANGQSANGQSASGRTPNSLNSNGWPGNRQPSEDGRTSNAARNRLRPSQPPLSPQELSERERRAAELPDASLRSLPALPESEPPIGRSEIDLDLQERSQSSTLPNPFELAEPTTNTAPKGRAPSYGESSRTAENQRRAPQAPHSFEPPNSIPSNTMPPNTNQPNSNSRGELRSNPFQPNQPSNQNFQPSSPLDRSDASPPSIPQPSPQQLAELRRFFEQLSTRIPPNSLPGSNASERPSSTTLSNDLRRQLAELARQDLGGREQSQPNSQSTQARNRYRDSSPSVDPRQPYSRPSTSATAQNRSSSRQAPDTDVSSPDQVNRYETPRAEDLANRSASNSDRSTIAGTDQALNDRLEQLAKQFENFQVPDVLGADSDRGSKASANANRSPSNLRVERNGARSPGHPNEPSKADLFGPGGDIKSLVSRHGFSETLRRLVEKTLDEEGGTADSNRSSQTLNDTIGDLTQKAAGRGATNRTSTAVTREQIEKAKSMLDGVAARQENSLSSRSSETNSTNKAGQEGSLSKLAGQFWKSVKEPTKTASSAASAPAAGGQSGNGTSMIPDVSFRLGMEHLITVVVVGGLIALLLFLRRSVVSSSDQSVADRKWAKEVLKVGLKTRADVVRAYHHLVLRTTVPPAHWFAHRSVERHVEQHEPRLQDVIEELTNVYESARYLPPDQELAPEQVRSVQAAIERFESASA